MNQKLPEFISDEEEPLDNSFFGFQSDNPKIGKKEKTNAFTQTFKKYRPLSDFLSNDAPVLDATFSILPNHYSKDGQKSFTLKCKNDDKIIITEETLKKSPFLVNEIKKDLLISQLYQQITLQINHCTEEALQMAADFMNGDKTVWKRITVQNVQSLLLIAYTLQLQDLYNQCTVFYLNHLFSNGIPLSKEWKTDFPELYDEINTLLNMSKNPESFEFEEEAYMKVEVKGTEFFEKLQKIQRFSELMVTVTGTVEEKKSSVMDKLKKLTLKKEKLEKTQSYDKVNLGVKSLIFDGYDQSDFNFISKDVTYPLLKVLSLQRTSLCELKKLSEALNDGRMPVLEKLKLSGNKIQFQTLKLSHKIRLKSLKMSNCELEISLNDILNDRKIASLEELYLTYNTLSVNSKDIDTLIHLKRLYLTKAFEKQKSNDLFGLGRQLVNLLHQVLKKAKNVNIVIDGDAWGSMYIVEAEKSEQLRKSPRGELTIEKFSV